MEKPTNYKFHSTNQYRNVVKSVKDQAAFQGLDGEGKAILDYTKPAPTLTYVGTVKLHGTNGSIILHENGDISFHSKSQLLGFVREGEFTLLSDNAEFAQTMSRRMDSVYEIVENARRIAKGYNGVELFPLKISGEWCGQGIQKGVGISYLPKKSFFIFGIKAGETDQNHKQGWLPITALESSALSSESTQEDGIYSITDFPTMEVEIDFSQPEFAQKFLVQATEECENVCPVSKQLNLCNPEGEPQTLGEGWVWTPVDPDYCWDSSNWFKTKGKKHSVSKTKSVAAIDPVKLANIQEFIEYAVTENRMEQGVQEVGLDQKLVGAFIGWVNKDINKEEGDVLEKNNLTMKDVGKYTANTAREFYLNKLNNM